MIDRYTPSPGSAPFARQVLAQTSMEARLMLRNGEQILLAVVIPMLVLVAAVLGAERFGIRFAGRPVDVFTPGVLALSVLSSAFTSLAVATGFERRYGVIKRLGASPLSRTGLLLGKAGSVILIELLQFLLVGGVGLALGWRPHWHPGALVLLVLGTAAFSGLGLLMAGTLRAEATLALANLVFLLLMAAGGVVLPTSSYGVLGKAAALLPSGALGDGLRQAFGEGTFSVHAAVVLLVWAVVAAALTARTFKWD